MFAPEYASGGRSLAYVLLYLIHAATAGAQDALPNNQYTLIRFADTPDGPIAEYTVSVPNDVQGTLRMTDLGCPGERYTVISGSVPLFQTKQVPANPACVNPLSLSEAPQAFSSGEYSTGQASLPPGDYTIRITPLETASGDAAIGFFSSAAAREASSGVVASTDTLPDISVGTAITAEGPSETLADTALPEGLQSTEAPSDTESLSPPDEAGDFESSESPSPVDTPSEGLSLETLTGGMGFPQSPTETPTESSLTGALPEATEDVSSSVAGAANNVVTVTATGYVTVTTTTSIAVTTDDGNTVTTTLTDATETVVSTVDSEIAVTETPSPSYTVMTLFTTATSLETLTSEITMGVNTITVTEVITVIQDVADYTIITLPATTTTQEETSLVVETSTAFTTTTTSLEGDAVTTTIYVTYYQTAIVSDGVTETIGGPSDSVQLTLTGETNTESLETVTATGSEDCTVPVVTSIVDFTFTDSVVVFTTALPELTTATETSTVGTTTTTIDIGRSADQVSIDETGTPSSPTTSETANFTNEPGVETPTNTEAASAETSFPNGNSAILPANASPLPIESTEFDITSKLKRHFLRSWVGALLAPDIAREDLAKRQLGEDPEVATVTIVGETPTVTVFVTEVCLPSTTPTGITTTSTASQTNSESSASTAGLSSTESAEPSSTATPPLPLTCGTRKSNLVLITDVLTFSQARESCRALRLRLATLRRFNTVVDAVDLLGGCNVTEVWINPASVNTIARPQCFALARDQWYEPEDCLTTTRPVLCANSR